ncbi:MAG: hypothetical protein Q9170_008162 [Blastenia crenularia]
MEQLHYLDEGSNATADNAGQTIGTCLLKYCDALPDCIEYAGFEHGALDDTSFWASNSDNTGYYDPIGPYLVWLICAVMPASVNSDVGGIGVSDVFSARTSLLIFVKIYVSYWIQTGLAILGFVGTLFWGWVFPKIYAGTLALGRGRIEAKMRSKEVDRLAQRHLSRLVASLTDFHKSQCFFMLATNIAALVVVRKGGLDPQNLQQMYNTWIFLKLVAINGLLPITFTLTNLYMVGILSWYMIMVSCSTVALSIGTFAAVGRFNPSESEVQHLANIANSGGPQECNYKQPGVYCYSPISTPRTWYDGSIYSDSTIDSDAGSILSFCLVVISLLLGHKLHMQNLAPVGRLQTTALARLTSSGIYFRAFLQHLERCRIGGMQRGFDHRLLAPYRVSKSSNDQQDSTAEADETTRTHLFDNDLEEGRKPSFGISSGQSIQPGPVEEENNEMMNLPREQNYDDANDDRHDNSPASPATIIP